MSVQGAWFVAEFTLDDFDMRRVAVDPLSEEFARVWLEDSRDLYEKHFGSPEIA
ncbi:hypothetical protein BSU04_05145 [Caballeronia sordidicola]|uniref:Uncharacterized protein n=1 Tax=Caballeronia sordidicola TaxID=196367 RepID=A0A226X9I8_CABSO|nr:hypothetical protein BSU04_05145 [Caballeronia sordidicola]